MGGGYCEMEETGRMDCGQSICSGDFQAPASLCKPLFVTIKVGGPKQYCTTPASFAASPFSDLAILELAGRLPCVAQALA